MQERLISQNSGEFRMQTCSMRLDFSYHPPRPRFENSQGRPTWECYVSRLRLTQKPGLRCSDSEGILWCRPTTRSIELTFAISSVPRASRMIMVANTVTPSGTPAHVMGVIRSRAMPSSHRDSWFPPGHLRMRLRSLKSAPVDLCRAGS